MVLSGQRELSWFRRQFAIQGLPEELAFNEAGDNISLTRFVCRIFFQIQD